MWLQAAIHLEVAATEEPVTQPRLVLVPQFCLRYLDNIHLHPEEEKYRKIKLQNKVFQVRALLSDFPASVASVAGPTVAQGLVWRWDHGRAPPGVAGGGGQRWQVERGFMNIGHT